MPEDNLIQLYDGTEVAFINGVQVAAPPIERAMVMIYPKEGAMPRTNCACIVLEDWVTDEHVDAAQRWIAFIREDRQQRAFMAAGFRPGTDMSIDGPESKINARYGLDPADAAGANKSLADSPRGRRGHRRVLEGREEAGHRNLCRRYVQLDDGSELRAG